MKLRALVVALVLVAGSAATASATVAAPGRPAAATRTVWLCRPGVAPDPCTASRTATRVAADGSTSTQPAAKAKPGKIDCFYVYPTVSLQATMNANLDIDPNEINVAKAQASRFSQVCNVYAPIYRQLTLRAIGGGATAANAAIAYGDVRDAWRDYLARYNHGHGVVLIGHSQGAGMLTRLVKDEIDPKRAARAKLVSAVLLGGNVIVPKGKDVGGDFKHIPACRSATQTACVVAYSSFDQTPPANSLFGRADNAVRRALGNTATAASSQVLCVNPAALRGGSAAVHAYFPTHLPLGVLGGALPADVVARVSQPWVTYPGLYRAECRNENGASWLQIDDVRQPGDVRPHLIDSLGASWGLHLVDANITAGELVALTGRQAAAWSRKH